METAPHDDVEDGETPMQDFWELTQEEREALAPFDPNPIEPGDDIAILGPDGVVEFLIP